MGNAVSGGGGTSSYPSRKSCFPPEPQFPHLHNGGVGPAQGVSVGSVELLETRFGGGCQRKVSSCLLFHLFLSMPIIIIIIIKISLIIQALSRQTGRWLGLSGLDTERQESTVDTHQGSPQSTRRNMKAVVRPQTCGSCVRF